MEVITDIVIPLGNGSRYDDIELKFCLRSIEKHLKGVGKIFIIGKYPDWIRNVIHVSCDDFTENTRYAENIYRKILTAMGVKELTEEFLFMNDDHFLLADFDAWRFPNFHRGRINSKNYEGNMPQIKQMESTVDALGYGLDYDIHCPIVYAKYKFWGMAENLELFKPWPDYGFGIKSLYGNTFSLGGQHVEDLKFQECIFMKESIYLALEGRDWFSIGDRVLKGGGMIAVLQELYPKKSFYEA